ncbi:MAG: peptidoglycan-binding protein [Hyphomicrobiales bacterium]|nr:peptidoglycan-binding protein [Hyphomicrobiales bacterium]MCC2106215.1 peptidoglycan-binding protein [Hyphomicrobiales bacterium]
MRKAARKDLDFDFDYDDDAPRSEAPKKRARISATQIGVFGLATLSLAIVVNAAFLQDQRRSAPLFKVTLGEPETRPAPQPQALPPLPPPRVVEATPQPVQKIAPPEPPRTTAGGSKVDLIARELGRGSDPIAREIARLETPAPRVEKPAPVERPRAEKSHAEKPRAEKSRAEKPQHAKAAPAEPRRKDAIAGLLQKSEATSQKAREPASTDVLAAQRALQRLGFIVRPNGVFDSTTRQAIAQFERDRHMPARGELTAAIKRELLRSAEAQ